MFPRLPGRYRDMGQHRQLPEVAACSSCKELVHYQETLPFRLLAKILFAESMQMIVVFDIFVDAGVLSHFKIEERNFMIWVSKVCQPETYPVWRFCEFHTAI